jgi:hypothetical protein
MEKQQKSPDKRGCSMYRKTGSFPAMLQKYGECYGMDKATVPIANERILLGYSIEEDLRLQISHDRVNENRGGLCANHNDRIHFCRYGKKKITSANKECRHSIVQ